MGEKRKYGEDKNVIKFYKMFGLKMKGQNKAKKT